ncbi:MAG: TonB-dependent siderophore receptor [Betaproteobacteria bacterium]|nr:TonB-dependent siderophore receptor [Betaproteobacteria bacterium]
MPDSAAKPGPAETALPAVEVTGGRDPRQTGYQGGTTNVGKSNQLPKDIPQSVTIVTSQLMKDCNADTFREALRNVAGLTFNAGEGGRIGDNITLRGYSAVGDLYLDGIRDVAQYNRETFNLEQIDVLRGSASMLFGRGSTGGVINQVSKAPSIMDRNAVTLTAGSNDYKRAAADLNKLVAANTALRVNLMQTDTDSFRDGVHQERWGVAPSLRAGIGTRDDFTLSYTYLKEDNVPDYGVPYFQGRPLQVPVSRFYGLAGTDYERNETGIATATYVHRLDQDTSVKTVLRRADYERDLRAVAPRLAGGVTDITDATVVNRQRQARGGEEHTWTSQTDLTTLLRTGRIAHRLLAGFEYAQEDAHRWTNSSSVANPATTVGDPNLYPALPANFNDSFSRTGDNYYEARTAGLYVQDSIELAPEWKLVLGARYDNFKADYDRPAPAGPLSRTDRVWSTRAGILFQPTETTTWYASYGTSFNPSAELYQLDDRGANTPPEKNRNVEVGIKFEAQDGDLSLRAALFRSEKTNERNTDLSVSVEQNLLSGKRHTDGIELEAAGRINARWEVFGALALMRGKIDAATGQQANTVGLVPLNTPKVTYALWTTYALGGGWKIGGGFDGAGLRYGQNTNTTAAPAYTRWDALLEYKRNAYALKLNVLNLFDRDYYEGRTRGT